MAVRLGETGSGGGGQKICGVVKRSGIFGQMARSRNPAPDNLASIFGAKDQQKQWLSKKLENQK
jgi:hypothetical protein